ncbi:AAA family ATPase [Miniimonas arenae]|uniref:AAA family ATPase n=1 Tax=Miniimonas arenae TaxID=676201 RepID=A0A5C5BC72_9MICO|nr:AAA family ATPase [Miniimonas arenae]TNU74114.1 AAA family ATPase [Miniimonas arenae]
MFFTSASMSPSPDDRPRPDGSGEEPPPPPDAYADSRLDTFLTAFHRLSQAAAARAASEAAGGVGLVARVTDHLGVNPGTLPVVTEAVAPMRVVDIDVAVAHVVEAHGGGELVGVGGGDQRWHMSFADMLQENGWARLRVGAVEYRRESTGPDTERDIVAYGLHLFRHDGVPVALLQRGSNPQFGGEPKLEVVSPDADAVRRVLAEVREAMSTHSVLRGQVVVFTSSPFEPGSGGVSFLARPRIESGQIVLPDGLLARLRRHVIGIGERASELRALGQHLKRGVLLYGPPGTGKTLTVRHLVGESSSTVIVLTGAALANITLAARTARALAPSILVLEDCDLVAEERSTYTSSPLLFEVLDALDGLDPDADVTFLLTTNRVDVLEPALAQRPGRIDLAVELPLPDERARLALLEVYARHLDLGAEALASAARETTGTTASLAKELVRRAVLTAAEEGRAVADEDLAAAVAEVMREARGIGQSMLGASPARAAAAPGDADADAAADGGADAL